jgi:transposase-like protein
VLSDHGGSVRKTAAHYQRDRRQIYRWLDQYGLRDKR